MKKTYILPSIRIVTFGNDICESLLVGSGQTESTRGNGVDLVKDNSAARSDYNVWDDDWSNN